MAVRASFENSNECVSLPRVSALCSPHMVVVYATTTHMEEHMMVERMHGGMNEGIID